MKGLSLLFCLILLVDIAPAMAGERMVLIDPGQIKATPKQRFEKLKPFYIDSFEVSIRQFTEFIQQTNYKGYKGYRKPRKQDLEKGANRVHWFEAARYCQWKGKRLPTETEWLLAAGGEGRKFPWGNDHIDGKRANHCDVNCTAPWANFNNDDHFKRMAPVGSYPGGSTPEGVYDLAGNVWEWTSTVYSNGESLVFKGKEQPLDDMEVEMVIKGGSYGSKDEQLQNGHRSKSAASLRSSYVGFRCAKDKDRPVRIGSQKDMTQAK